MIKQLFIHNFQSHEVTSLDLADGLNVIIGSSNQGKSAVLRAIAWLRTNRPGGTSFIRQGSDGDCSVKLTTADGVEIVRRRKGKVNTYCVSGETLEAMGAAVPQQVTDALGLDEINVAGQVEMPFLILDAPGKIARTLNDVVHLDRAEGAASAINGRLRELAQSTKAAEARREELDAAKATFAALPTYAAKVEMSLAISDKLAKLDIILAALRGLRQTLADTTAALAAARVPANAKALCGQLEAVAIDLAARQALAASVGNLTNEIRQTESQLAAVGPVSKALKLANGLEKAAHRFSNTNKSFQALDGLLNQVVQADADIDHARRTVEAAGVEYTEALAGLQSCPACGQRLDMTAKQHLLECG